MEPDIRATIFTEGGKLIGQVIRFAFNRPPKHLIEEAETTAGVLSTGSASSAAPSVPKAAESRVQRPALPTTAETTAILKRRLAKELYKAELDLASGLKIAGKPCDCLDNKHSLYLEAATEELVAQDPDNPVYPEILDWVEANQPKVSVEAILSGRYAAEYPKMALQFKEFRKRVMGTMALSDIHKPGTEINLGSVPGEEITLAQAKKIASAEAAREVEKRWHSQEKK